MELLTVMYQQWWLQFDQVHKIPACGRLSRLQAAFSPRELHRGTNRSCVQCGRNIVAAVVRRREKGSREAAGMACSKAGGRDAGKSARGVELPGWL